ncbi:TrwC relaxase [Kribbella capetownensis]|uniref:TrwC relaxase n=1 Tax=Kribbella capetownensis TaxID=1572659 RepID=A0A4R0K400_9ACTN|nr:MobF family relaxase [Kribbella capetownensis]TCC53474.1 TrwC relaxase [Kribbella capetownensis]
MAVVSINSGHRADYLTGQVATGRENYYTGAVAAGEPPGRWFGKGAEALGLAGEVDTQDMTALYERFIDPRDEAFRDPARWDEAETLGNTGRAYKTEEQEYADALAKEPGADAERRAELRALAAKSVRKNVAFHDATFSVQKSVTILHTAFEAQEVQARGAAEAARGALEQAHRTGDAAVHQYGQAVQRAETEAASWGQYRQSVEDAIWAGNQAALNYLQDKAGYTRIGHWGGAAGRWDDAHEWTVASFFQHDSRDHDPQLHIHNAILNRVQGTDGKWRTVDGEALHRYQPGAGAVGERVMEHHLSKALGVRFEMRPDGKSREVVGIDQPVMDLFSSRRKAITKKTAVLVREFEAQFRREPTNLELARLQQTATLATRKAKSHDGETVAERLQRWDQQLRAEVRGGLGIVARDVLATTGRSPVAQTFSEAKVLDMALAEVQRKQAEWEAPDLTREISNALPDDLGDRTPAQIVELLEQLTEKGLRKAVVLAAERPGESQLPAELRLADGTSAYRAPGGTRYATGDHLKAERQLARAGYARGAALVQPHLAEAFCRELGKAGLKLGTDQEAAVRGILTSGARVETLIGPAGTGKSRVVGALAKAWEDPKLWFGEQHRMIGLAASQVATEVLAADGVTARNIGRWLMTQQHIADGSATREELAWQLRDGDLVVVDESAMAATSDLAAINRLCDEAGAKLLLVGDHRQLAAVGAAGGMELVASGALTHELTETRRFQAEWEGPASLRLRTGDQSVLGEYHKQGRILDGGTVERAQHTAADAWLADHLNGLHSLLIVDTNDQAAQVSAQLRAKLVEYGRVDDTVTVPLAAQGTHAGAGDLIQARHNDWRLAKYNGNQRAVFNRDEFEVIETRPDGGLIVAPLERGSRRRVPGETVELPASYVREHVALGYAATVHSSQGLTVDTVHSVTTQNTSLYALYVAMTRGRVANTTHVVTQAVASMAEIGETKHALKRSPLAVLGAAFDLEQPQISALQAQAEAAAEAGHLRTPAELLTDGIAVATAGRCAQWLDELTEQGLLTPQQRTKLAAEDGAGTLATLLRRAELAGHDPRHVLTEAVTARTLTDARRLSYVLHDRITKTTPLDPVGNTHTAWVPRLEDPAWSSYLHDLAAEADHRATTMAEQVAADPPPWAVEAFGPAPAERDARAEWIEQAAVVIAHRELADVTAADTALGPAPKPGQVEAYASWRAAWRALGRPDTHRAEAEMSNGQLRVRVRAYEREQAWAPPSVAEELAGTRQQADNQRRTATLRTAEADATTDPDTATRLRAEATEANALAHALDARAGELAIADQARAEWYAHTAATRDAAARAAEELQERGIDNTDNGHTADEWLAADRGHDTVEDNHRVVTAEHELADITQQRATDTITAAPGQDHLEPALVNDQPASKVAGPDDAVGTDPTAEAVSDDIATTTVTDQEAETTDAIVDSAALDSQAPADIRQIAAAEERITESDTPRVPTADESAEAVRRAQRALIEIHHRRAVEDDHAASETAERDEDLARWHADDTQPDTASRKTTNRVEQAEEDSFGLHH